MAVALEPLVIFRNIILKPLVILEYKKTAKGLYASPLATPGRKYLTESLSYGVAFEKFS